MFHDASCYISSMFQPHFRWLVYEITLRFQLSEARFITSINIICLSPHKPPFTRSLTIYWDPNWPRSLLAAFKILLLIEDSHQELVSAQFCFDLCCTRHYSTDCVTFDKCTFQRVGVGWVGSENVTATKATVRISVAKLVTGFPRMIWTWASACRHFLGYFFRLFFSALSVHRWGPIRGFQDTGYLGKKLIGCKKSRGKINGVEHV